MSLLDLTFVFIWLGKYYFIFLSGKSQGILTSHVHGNNTNPRVSLIKNWKTTSWCLVFPFSGGFTNLKNTFISFLFLSFSVLGSKQMKLLLPSGIQWTLRIIAMTSSVKHWWENHKQLMIQSARNRRDIARNSQVTFGTKRPFIITVSPAFPLPGLFQCQLNMTYCKVYCLVFV